ncbi:MAG TPA: ribonuclease PH [bacterium]|nr:ribonuclease PH [bacterium]
MNERSNGRKHNEIRKLNLTRNYLPYPEGSCFVELGQTRVITTATVENSVPQWLKGNGTGWVTAEYGMLPRSTHTRNRRTSSANFPSGRTMEIQRLIGRTLRAVTDLEKLGERSIYIDCDVINADGGTRVASIIGAAVALHDAGTWLVKNDITREHIIKELVSAVSIGIIDEKITVDLCYEEDSSAEVDMNIVMTESGKFVEIQGTAEGKTFDRDMLDKMLDSAQSAIKEIIAIQKAVLA